MFVSCQEEVTPKPAAYLRLDYPEANYVELNNPDAPFCFEVNEYATIGDPVKNKPNWININYPKLKGELHITYLPVQDNLKRLLREAQNITQNHTQKADGINQVVYDNEKQQVHGIVYEVEGDAASPVQFYVTDNKKHFLSGSVYFKTKPNYDSILPAAHYLKKDVQQLIESLKWSK